MTAEKAVGLSLWLMPEGTQRARLASQIASLAARFSTPAFAPHLTLLAAIDEPLEDRVLAAAQELARRLAPIRIQLEAVEGRDEYFRCLFARAVADAPLLSAHAAAAHAFGRTPDPAFLPHVSLVYGLLAPGLKQQLAREPGPALAGSFLAERLHVWRTQGHVSEWQELGAFALSR